MRDAWPYFLIWEHTNFRMIVPVDQSWISQSGVALRDFSQNAAANSAAFPWLASDAEVKVPRLR
jgi:hypothetical protein